MPLRREVTTRTIDGAHPSSPGERDVHPNRIESKKSRRLLRAGRLALALGSVGLLAAACGGGSASPDVASLGSTTTTTATAAATPAGNSGSTLAQLKYAQCMQTHGVSNFPDPGPGALAAMRNVDLGAPKYQAAFKTCQAVLPDGGALPTTPLSPKVLAEALKFTQCMRSHGMTNWPEPTSNAYAVASPGAGSSSTYVNAAKACNGLLPKRS
jgi:ABC-type glycerol-3-phosphate transport system substrate-binding protein